MCSGMSLWFQLAFFLMMLRIFSVGLQIFLITNNYSEMFPIISEMSNCCKVFNTKLLYLVGVAGEELQDKTDFAVYGVELINNLLISNWSNKGKYLKSIYTRSGKSHVIKLQHSKLNLVICTLFLRRCD